MRSNLEDFPLRSENVDGQDGPYDDCEQKSSRDLAKTCSIDSAEPYKFLSRYFCISFTSVPSLLCAAFAKGESRATSVTRVTSTIL